MEVLMKKIILISLITSNFAFAEGYPDGSTMGTPEMAKCAVAALKTDMERWKKWSSALEQRYLVMYKVKMTEKEIQNYTFERVNDKKKELYSRGFDSKRSFEKYFEMNCAGEI